jgi:hypothetical protein
MRFTVPDHHDMMKNRRSFAPLYLCPLALAACGDGASGPTLPPRLEFSEQTLELGYDRGALVEIRNSGGSAVGPVEIQPGSIQDASGASVPGARVLASPAEIPTLNPGSATTVSLDVSLQGTLAPGRYDASVVARAGTEASATMAVRFQVPTAEELAAASLTLGPVPESLRQGDVLWIPVEVRDADGVPLPGAPVSWTVEPAGAGYVGPNGQFVGYAVGPVTVTARVGTAVGHAAIDIGARALSGSFTVVGEGRESQRYTSDLWLWGDYAYTGTWGGRESSGAMAFGNTMFAWDASDPADPRKVGSVRVDARTVNDVKVRADGRLAVMTHEGSNDGLNGITVLDLSDPADPTPVGRFSRELEAGVHNVWLDGDHAYLVVDGAGGLRVLDLSDPADPTIVARYYAGSSFLHDVYVRDGLAFLSHWNAGLVILDVGHGIVGGSPERPVEVSRLADLGGQTHNAWYWPDEGYVFVGEEDFSSPGQMHVVDIRNLREPREVATFRVPGQTPHNFWLDETRGVLYLAWYGKGVRALDVSGELLGELDRQGREIAALQYGTGLGLCDRSGDDTCSWAPQLHRGLVWVADMNRGLVTLQPPG